MAVTVVTVVVVMDPELVTTTSTNRLEDGCIVQRGVDESG